jgi:hypothetical protein
MHSKSCRLQRKDGDHDGQSGERQKGPGNRSGRERIKGEKRFNVEATGRTKDEGRTEGEELEKTWKKKEGRREKVKWGRMIQRIKRYGRDKIRIKGLTDQP